MGNKVAGMENKQLGQIVLLYSTPRWYDSLGLESGQNFFFWVLVPNRYRSDPCKHHQIRQAARLITVNPSNRP